MRKVSVRQVLTKENLEFDMADDEEIEALEYDEGTFRVYIVKEVWIDEQN